MTNVAEKPFPFGAAQTHMLFPTEILDCGFLTHISMAFKVILCLHLYDPYTDWYL